MLILSATTVVIILGLSAIFYSIYRDYKEQKISAELLRQENRGLIAEISRLQVENQKLRIITTDSKVKNYNNSAVVFSEFDKS